MLQNLRHPKVAEFVAVCPKPVAIMMLPKQTEVSRNISQNSARLRAN